ncbi:ABC transporter ATP-binding protein [Caldimonas sp. KR1-144]|uniref:ABC transporter ATP-binding protein n=1 Tax=Caldimonas sp. KR1-144 TaxID=3400911 RepID=UPI003BFE98BC
MLSVRGLTKRYGERTALDNLSLELRAGSFTVLLGPNGAGKSTLFQVVTGLFAADAGEVEIAGHSLRREPSAALRALGVVFQQSSLDLDLSIRRNLLLQADLQGLPRALAQARIAEGCERLQIDADLTRKVRELSGGNRRKVELVRAGLHRPVLFLMDEATVGLDPKSRRDLLAALHADVRERGASVLWATHWVEEAAEADRVLVLHKGRLLADGTREEVTAALGEPTLEQGFIARTGNTAGNPAADGPAAARKPPQETNA